MTGDVNLTASAWGEASADLGIDVTAPFNLDDESAPCVAWVANFGSAQGTVVVGRRTPSEGARSIANSQGMYCSEIDEAAYSRYDRDLFIATLNDWGWHGDPTTAPDWYTGETWG